MTDLLDRIRAKTRSTRDGECWEFLGAKTYGYGVISVSAGRSRQVHRVAYELLIGPIPAGLQLDHLCRNRACWNPGHLDPVTQAENLRRGDSSLTVRAIAAEAKAKTHCEHDHPFDADNTYIRPNGTRSCRTCQRERGRRHIARKRGKSA